MLNRLQDVFRSFQQHDVKYVVIGGIASVLYGVPRATFDLDILIEASIENAERLLHALSDAGMGTASLIAAKDLLANEITIFKDRVRVDVQTTTPGLRFADGWARRNVMTYQGQDFFVVSKEDLIRSKRAAGRPVDREDVRLLELTGSDGSDEESPRGD
ncbi:MAG: nucleotidyltransferase family protein [Acidobacteria bacterium]|nr:nucleotidyltransferase family protein [Acidobacteriota bacterium]